MEKKVLRNSDIKRGYFVYFSKQHMVYQKIEYSIVSMKIDEKIKRSIVFNNKELRNYEDVSIDDYLLKSIQDDTIILFEDVFHPNKISKQIQKKFIEFIYEKYKF